MRVVEILNLIVSFVVFALSLFAVFPILVACFFYIVLKLLIKIPRYISLTAIVVLYTKWVYLGIQINRFNNENEITRFIKNTDFLVYFPLLIIVELLLFVEDISGFKFGFLNFPDVLFSYRSVMYLRELYTRFELLEYVSSGKVKQIVLLGAGFDVMFYEPRILRLCKKADVSLYEVDLPEISLVKQKAVVRAGLFSPRVKYIPGDLNESSKLLTNLENTGFNRNKKTLFIINGVFYYLSRQAVDSVMSRIVSNISESVVIFDFIRFDELPFGLEYILKIIGEPLEYSLPSGADSKNVIENIRTWIGTFNISIVNFKCFNDFGGCLTLLNNQ